MTVRITQQAAPLKSAALERLDSVMLFIPEKKLAGDWSGFPATQVLKNRLTRAGERAAHDKPLVTDLPNRAGTRVSLSVLPQHASGFALLDLVRQHVQQQLAFGACHIGVAAPGLVAAEFEPLIEALTAAILAANAQMPDYRSAKSSRKKPSPRTLQLQFFGVTRQVDLARTRAEAEGNALARTLTITPPNELTPALYRRRIAALAREHGWRMRFLDSRALKRKHAGAFLAVAQGSASDDAGIIELSYQPAKRTRAPALCLVGKGICFDTGGVNVKPARYMQGMHEDMEGSAVALGTLLALTRLRAPFPIKCWLALAQNHIGPRAYKPTDVVTASNGTTIEVVHTDAEGRMVLADTLALASREEPALIIDYATLTGSCVAALGTAYSGAITNRDALREEIIAAGRASGERVWPFPFDPDYDKALESRIADIKQCTLDSEADHILAARFLSRFVGETPWVHIDLSAGNHKGGLAHIPTDVTGFGVRFTLNLLLDRKVMDKLAA
ncbi:MAG: leucyl aminopeptidase family protein [Chromatiales bacterium]|jgi:leucyl aminopeptidase|nr:leucyl aminopeptidase family protein [Chromatiales bacterium]